MVHKSTTILETNLSPESKSWDFKAIDLDVYFLYFFGGLECVGTPMRTYVAHFVYLKDVWIRIQSAAVSSRRTACLIATHLPCF